MKRTKRPKKAKPALKKARKRTAKRKIASKTAKRITKGRKNLKAVKAKAPRKAKTPVAPKVDLTAGLELIGQVTHYFPHVKAAVLTLEKPICCGDQVYIKGHTTDFKQKIESMQIDHVVVTEAKVKDEIGLLVQQRVRIGDKVYKL